VWRHLGAGLTKTQSWLRAMAPRVAGRLRDQKRQLLAQGDNATAAVRAELVQMLISAADHRWSDLATGQAKPIGRWHRRTLARRAGFGIGLVAVSALPVTPVSVRAILIPIAVGAFFTAPADTAKDVAQRLAESAAKPRGGRAA
jgi:hypothetical protein